MSTTDISFTIYTQHGREPVGDIQMLMDRLNYLAGEKRGFVRLEMNPPIDGMRYIEGTYDECEKSFYVCILEDRENGQGFLERRRRRLPKKLFKNLFLKGEISAWDLKFFYSKSTGVWKSVTCEGTYEHLYMEPFEVTSEVFNEDAEYGGNQSWPMNVQPDSAEGKVLYETVRKYYPDFTDEQVKAFFAKLENEGCGYVVGVNMIFSHFEGREAEFEQKFGFPMHTKSGKLNYNLLLVDYYAATDNHIWHKGADVINYNEDCMGDEKDKPYDYTMDVTGFGTTDRTRKYRLQSYLENKGVKVNVSSGAAVSPTLIKSLLQKGFIHMALMGGNVQYEDGSTRLYCPGHSMLITGISNDCRYIVSSWGKKYYVDPNEVIEKDGKKTRIYYQYYEFEQEGI